MVPYDYPFEGKMPCAKFCVMISYLSKQNRANIAHFAWDCLLYPQENGVMYSQNPIKRPPLFYNCLYLCLAANPHKVATIFKFPEGCHL